MISAANVGIFPQTSKRKGDKLRFISQHVTHKLTIFYCRRPLSSFFEHERTSKNLTKRGAECKKTRANVVFRPWR